MDTRSGGGLPGEAAIGDAHAGPSRGKLVTSLKPLPAWGKNRIGATDTHKEDKAEQGEDQRYVSKTHKVSEADKKEWDGLSPKQRAKHRLMILARFLLFSSTLASSYFCGSSTSA